MSTRCLIEQVGPPQDGRADLIARGGRSRGGLNDRFAFCTGRGARAYANRIDEFEARGAAIGAMPSDRFLAPTAARHGLPTPSTGFPAVWLRADGKLLPNDRDVLDAFIRVAAAAE